MNACTNGHTRSSSTCSPTRPSFADRPHKRASEAYTSQTCPNCKHKHKPPGRDFNCPQCSFEAHRDVVGARNILNERYPGDEPTGSTQVAGEGPKRSVMASPTGIRYRP
ncbi:zinc ribbon domain-containing protein, partial [Salinibacter ruber]